MPILTNNAWSHTATWIQCGYPLDCPILIGVDDGTNILHVVRTKPYYISYWSLTPSMHLVILAKFVFPYFCITLANVFCNLFSWLCWTSVFYSFREVNLQIIDLTCTKRTLLIDKSLPGGSLWGCSFGGGGERTGFATLWFGVPLGSSNGWGMVRAMLVCRSPQQKADLYDQNKRFPAPPTGDTAWSMSTWLILTRIIVYLAITLLHTR